MKTVYSPLLSLRQVEEKQAEVALADAQRYVSASEKALAVAYEAREAWLNNYLTQALIGTDTTGLAELLTRIELVEQEARERLDEANRRLDEARNELIQRRRQREAVEQLHLEAIEAATRELARRRQAELDELGALSTRMRTEIENAH